jgi:hypothetical protein
MGWRLQRAGTGMTSSTIGASRDFYCHPSYLFQARRAPINFTAAVPVDDTNMVGFTVTWLLTLVIKRFRLLFIFFLYNQNVP